MNNIISQLQKAIKGSIVTPKDKGYGDARQVYNRAISSKPIAIIFCQDKVDILRTLQIARNHHIPFTIRSAGRCSPHGYSIDDNCLVIDLSNLNSVFVDIANKQITIEGGATWADCDQHTLPFHLTPPSGIVPIVGVAGFTLTGGISTLSRRLGLAIDNLCSLECIDANGKLLKASLEENNDLYWALRGGGAGHFGVITQLTLQLHPIKPQLLFCKLIWPITEAAPVLNFYFNYFANEAPPDLTLYATLCTYDDDQFLVIKGVYFGEPCEGNQLMAQFSSVCEPLITHAQVYNFADIKRHFFEEGDQHFGMHWKTGVIKDIPTQDFIDHIIDIYQSTPSPLTVFDFELLNGKIHETSKSATAFPHRDNLAGCLMVNRWHPQADADTINRIKIWADSVYQQCTPFFVGICAAYLDKTIADYPVQVYQENLPRLISIKEKYDPDNIFAPFGNLNNYSTFA